MFLPPLDPDFAALAEVDMGVGFGTGGFDLAGMRAGIDAVSPLPPATAEVDAERIVVAGASPGGGIAAGLALAGRDCGLPLAGQLLLYPMLDDRQQTPSSRWNNPIWSQTANDVERSRPLKTPVAPGLRLGRSEDAASAALADDLLPYRGDTFLNDAVKSP